MKLKSDVSRAPVRSRALIVPASLALLAAGCAQSGLQSAGLETSALQSSGSETANANSWQATARHEPAPDVQLKPETAALVKEARALRSIGKKDEALALLDKSPERDKDAALLRERGMLALELGKAERAKDLLTRSQNGSAPDWHVYSALGAALSATGKQPEAQAEFAKALALAPDHPAILNNLALSYALDGKHDEAERMLRKASSAAESEPQAKQNLALLLGLNGNIDEARQVSSTVLPPDASNANVNYLEKLKAGGTKVSAVDGGLAAAIRQASIADTGDKPIMQLGGTPE